MGEVLIVGVDAAQSFTAPQGAEISRTLVRRGADIRMLPQVLEQGGCACLGNPGEQKVCRSIRQLISPLNRGRRPYPPWVRSLNRTHPISQSTPFAPPPGVKPFLESDQVKQHAVFSCLLRVIHAPRRSTRRFFPSFLHFSPRSPNLQVAVGALQIQTGGYPPFYGPGLLRRRRGRVGGGLSAEPPGGRKLWGPSRGRGERHHGLGDSVRVTRRGWSRTN